VNHHIKEEENEMFPGLQGRSGAQWEEVQQQMLTRREQLMSEMGLAQEGDEETEEDDEAVSAGGRSAGRGAGSSTRRGGRAEDRPQAASRRERTKK
jgi:hypothetical protein